MENEEKNTYIWNEKEQKLHFKRVTAGNVMEPTKDGKGQVSVGTMRNETSQTITGEGIKQVYARLLDQKAQAQATLDKLGSMEEPKYDKDFEKKFLEFQRYAQWKQNEQKRKGASDFLNKVNVDIADIKKHVPSNILNS